MKNLLILFICNFCVVPIFSQIGIGTTTPNSTLDVRGSLSVNYRSFTSAASASPTDNMLVFTGTTATTLTLPDASLCTGRVYWVKNTSTNSSVLTIATSASQTIDGLGLWTLTQTNKTMRLVSNGANWLVAAESLPGSTGNPWVLGGNNPGSLQNIGTTGNFDLPFITNNTEKMRLTSTGSLGIGTTTFNATYPERILADAGATGNTNFQNVIIGKGNTNSYAQLNIQNTNAGTGASSDVVATSDNGNETINYIDMGINSSANTNTFFGNADDAYLYNNGQNLLIGTSTAGKSLVFLTAGGTQATNERMRIDGAGNVGIGTNAPSANFHVASPGSASATIAQFLTPALSSTNATYLKLGKSLSNGDQADIVYNWTGANNTANYLGFSFYGKPIYMALTNAGNLGIGTASPNSTLSVTGSLSMNYRSGAGSYTLLATDYVIINTGATATWTLPLASSCNGRIYRLLNQGTGTVTLSQTVRSDAATTTTSLVQTAGSNFYEILSDGNEWRRIN
jgi:hypothetical protein